MILKLILGSLCVGYALTLSINLPFFGETDKSENSSSGLFNPFDALNPFKPNKSLVPSWLVPSGAEIPFLPANFTESSNRSTVCFGVLGCFRRREFFDPWKRPLNFWPQSPEEINVTYNLYTEENKYVPNVLSYNLTKEELLATKFDPKKPIKFITHGFGGSFDDMQWMGDIKDLIFELAPGEFNVFGVDWSKGAGSIIYQQAVANTRVVGAATAYFIQKLVEYTGVNVENVHLIGHSLGSHVSGYVGERFTEPKLGRITALDPAGPDFYPDEPAARLDKTDAAYVDAIHTDYGNLILEGLGLEDVVGKDDFYPNSGYRQPGCGITKGLFNVLSSGIGEGVAKTVACNHQRSWGLFLVRPGELDEECQFVGYQCKDYSTFEDGKCGDCGDDGNKCALFSQLGKDDKQTGRYFLQQEIRVLNTTNDRRLFFKTSDERPFCLHHYQVKIQMSDDMPRSATGFITLNLHGSRRSFDDVELSKTVNSFKAGNVYTSLVTIPKSLGTVNTVNIGYKFRGIQVLDPTKLFNKPPLYVNKLEINYMSNIDPMIREKFSAVLCPTTTNEIRSGESVVFAKCGNETIATGDSAKNKNQTTPSSLFPF